MRLLIVLALATCFVAMSVAVYVGSTGVTAGTAITLDIDELVEGSGLVVEGRVLSATPRWDERGRIETVYELLVERSFWGDDAAAQTVVLPGGVFPDGRGMVLAGMPQLTIGERSILFLSGEGVGGLRVPVGLSQGHVRVLDTPNGGHLAVRSHSLLHTVDALTGAPAGPAQDVLDYGGLVAEIHAAAARRAAREALGSAGSPGAGSGGGQH